MFGGGGGGYAYSPVNDGWTVFSQNGTTDKIIYVSASGNDGNNGLTTATPVLTIAHGVSLLTTGSADWLLFNKGDTWTNQSFGAFGKSGRSATQPMVIGAYGTGARPLLKTNDGTGNTAISTQGAGSADYLAILDIEFYDYTRDPSFGGFTPPAASQTSPVFFNANSKVLHYFHIEGCKFSWYAGGVGVTDSFGQLVFKFRRNVVAFVFEDASFNKESIGLFVSGVAAGSLLEENIFDRNGYNATYSGSDLTLLEKNHNFYIDHDYNGDYTGILTSPVTVRGNLSFMSPPAAGEQQRCGGTCDNNLFDGNGQTQQASNFSGPGGSFTNNVIMGMKDSASFPAIGITIAPDSHFTWVPTTTTGNIVSQEASSTGNGVAIQASGTAGATTTVTQNIVWAWDSNHAGLQTNGFISALNNDFDFGGANNNAGGTAPSEPFPNPTRSLATYDTSLGGPGTKLHFMSIADTLSKDNWLTAYTAAAVNSYVRAGFGR